MATSDDEWVFSCKTSPLKKKLSVNDHGSGYSSNEFFTSEVANNVNTPPEQELPIMNSALLDALLSDSNSDSGSSLSEDDFFINLESLRRTKEKLDALKRNKLENTSEEIDKKISNTKEAESSVKRRVRSDPRPSNEKLPETHPPVKRVARLPAQLAVNVLKHKKFEPPTKIFAPPTSQLADGSAWIPESKKTQLPIELRKDDIIELIRNNRVIIVSGSTGCGKSTQVPQYILNDCLQKGEPVNIICTQPRRIAATSLAHRVAFERETQLHGQVGYQIGGKLGYSTITRLRYVTTGILLEMLKSDRFLSSFTHIIMDEIHERNVDDDLMMSHLCAIMMENPFLKLIIMSATMNVEKFTKYFYKFQKPSDDSISKIPLIDVPSRTFPVDVFYLEDVCAGLNLDESLQNRILYEPRRPNLPLDRREIFVNWIFDCHQKFPPEQAFLVFLPGIAIISEVEDQLLSISELPSQEELKLASKPPLRIEIIKLHSTVSIDEQCLAMRRPPSGYRKIILATNVAESSITVPDVGIIFDSCLRKDVFYDKANRYYSLNEQWISKDCAEQRRGRTGRVAPGVIYRFVTRSFYSQLPDERTPEIRRTPLNSLLLRCIYANISEPREILKNCIDPPDDTAVDLALDDLEAIGAISKSNPIIQETEDWVQGSVISYEYDVTRLGTILAQLPLDLHSGLLVVYGIIFGVLDYALIIAAIIQNRGVIVQPQNQEIGIAAAFKRFHLDLPEDQPLRGGSDLISHLRAYLYWEESEYHKLHIEAQKEIQWCQQQFISLYWIREIQDLVITVRESLAYQGICSAPTKEERDPIRRNFIGQIPISDNTEDYGSGLEYKSIDEDERDYELSNAIKILDTSTLEELDVASGLSKREKYINEEAFLINDLRHNRSSSTTNRMSVPIHQISSTTRFLLNPWMNAFDRAYDITGDPVQLRCSGREARAWIHCPENFNRQHTIEFVAEFLPSKGKLIEFLEKDIGSLVNIYHPDDYLDKSDNIADDNVPESEFCYVEFVKPAKPIWTHSQDITKGLLPDAIFLAQKLKAFKTGQADVCSNSSEPTTSYVGIADEMKRFKLICVSGSPETSTALSPILRSTSGKTYLSKNSLFFPLIVEPGRYLSYTITACKLLAVEYGKAHVADFITCLIGPSSSQNNVGDVILALFGNHVKEDDNMGGWHYLRENETRYPLFYNKPSSEMVCLIKGFRYFLRQALFEPAYELNGQISSESANDHLWLTLPDPYSLQEVADTWRDCKMTPEEAGGLLVHSILMTI
ncbi:hypothetical protein G9A89_023513 [Geosiphon pyriformis]|nr:hypothetical protein G9A89_023513 [Geosiphon pyriformis]